MEHEAGRDVGGVDRALRRTPALLRFRSFKQRCRVMGSADIFGDGQHSDHFTEHPSVAPEAAARAI